MQWAHTVGSQGTPPVSAAALPQAPGVYRFRDRAGRVLYIGRAVSLRRRVLSYWETSATGPTWLRWWPGSPGSRR